MGKVKTMELEYRICSYLAFKHARDFFKSAKILDEKNIFKPVMVNIAFACELYMKALLIWKNQSQDIIGEHKLQELFYMLGESVQRQIKEESGIERWDEFLLHSSNAFCAWRYYYEKDNVMFGHLGGLLTFAGVLDEICENTISIK